MYLVSAAIRLVQELKSKRTADYLAALVETDVIVWRDEQWGQTSSTELKPGDKKNVTQSICRRLKLNTENIITGTDLQNINDDEILQKVESTEVFAELTPEQKSLVVKILQQNGHTVGFLGDGLNDINAITQVDTGIRAEKLL